MARKTPYPEKISIAQMLELARPGDIVAFGGKGAISNVIKVATRAPVSHVGVVLEGGKDGRILEAVSAGVVRHHLGLSVWSYTGEIWLLRLKRRGRHKNAKQAMFRFASGAIGKPYDTTQAVKSALDFGIIGTADKNHENYNAYFCSELAAAALEYLGVLDDVNCSEVTPIDLCRFAIYGRYFQVKGKPRKIRGFSRTDFKGFGY